MFGLFYQKGRWLFVAGPPPHAASPLPLIWRRLLLERRYSVGPKRGIAEQESERLWGTWRTYVLQLQFWTLSVAPESISPKGCSHIPLDFVYLVIDTISIFPMSELQSCGLLAHSVVVQGEQDWPKSGKENLTMIIATPFFHPEQ